MKIRDWELWLNQSLISNSPFLHVATVTAILVESTKPEELAEFYRQGFGWPEPHIADEEHLGFQLEHLYLGFERVKANAGPSRRVSLWFEVENITAVFAHLVKLGATVEYVPTADKSPGEILAKLFDPEGNSVGLIGKIED